MKKMVAMLLLVSLMAFSFTGCSAGNKEKANTEPSGNLEADTEDSETQKEAEGNTETMNITVSMQTFDNTFASFCMARMAIYNEEHPELNITYLDAANDAATQITQIEQAVINGTQAVICCVVDATQAQPIVTACKDAGVPLIAFNRVFEGCDTFVGANNADAGRIVAERAIELLDGSGKIALVQGVMGQANTYERTDAILEALAEHPDIEIVLDGAADWKRDKALELVETWIQSGTEFDLVIALNDDAALGAQQALSGAGKADSIPVLSINGDPSGINGVKDGILDCTAFQAPFTQADKALEIAVEYIQGGTPTDTFKVDYELITTDNVEDYMQFTTVEGE
ncbi:MAG: substrate-binding domain-containing protein [Lachnospiraceae bacterium]|nr:substrate-binding domain-containing protein [Lachnospiraceae bacterium]